MSCRTTTASLSSDISSKTQNLPWIKVKGNRFVDELGRKVKLRGVNARVDGLFDASFDDGRPPLEKIPKFDEPDVKTMQELGFNFLRLPINWSGLEPVEGKFSKDYINRLREIVAYCRKHSIYVLIDFHQTDNLGIGHALWLWKESSQDAWGVFDHSEETVFTVNPGAAKLLSTPYAQKVPHQILSHNFDEVSGELTVKFTKKLGIADLEIYKNHYWYPKA